MAATMNTTPTDAVVLKTHALGRVKTPAARREQLLDEFEQSGMSGVQFAEFRMGKLQRGRAQLSAERGKERREGIPPDKASTRPRSIERGESAGASPPGPINTLQRGRAQLSAESTGTSFRRIDPIGFNEAALN